MKWIVLTGILVVVVSPASAQTHDADFPDEMRAINQCYVYFINNPDRPRGDDELKKCVEGKGFKFCPDCKIFRYSGGSCEKDKENRYHRATCYRPQ
jgi:hypothetical protein